MGIVDGISAFLTSNGYKISRSDIQEAGGSITACAKERSFKDLLEKPVPQLVEVVLKQEDNDAVILLHLKPFGHLRLYAMSLTLLMVGVSSAVFKIGCDFAEARNVTAGVWCIWAFIASVLLTLAACYRTFDLLKVGTILTGIRSGIEKRTGHATYIQGGLPGFQYVVMPILVLMAALGIIAWDPDFWIMAVLSTPLLALMGIVYSKTGRMTRFFLGSLSFFVGITFCIYSTMPAWSAFFLRPLVKEQVGWCLRQDMSLPAAIRDSFPHSWQPHQLFTSRSLVALMVSAVLFIIVLGVGGLVVKTLGYRGSSAPQLVKDIEDLRARLSRSTDDVSKEAMSFSFKFQSIVWILFAPLNLFGMYLGLSSWELALFGTHRIFPMSLIDQGKVGLDLLAAFFGNTHPGAMWVPWFTRSMLLLYGAPMVLLLGLVTVHTGRRCWNRVRVAREARRFAGTMPEKLVAMARNIAEWGHVRVPRVRVTETNGIGASTMVSRLPWGRNVLTVTKDSLERLEEGELSGLLAHEIGHMKQRRSYVYELLSLISRWTFFGNGWLLGGFDWFEAEYEADAFALAWSQRENGKEEGRIVLIGMLKRLQQQEIAEAVGCVYDAEGDKLTAAGHSWLPRKVTRALASYAQMTMWRRMMTVLAIQYHLFLGDCILEYCHPDLSQRIERLRRT